MCNAANLLSFVSIWSVAWGSTATDRQTHRDFSYYPFWDLLFVPVHVQSRSLPPCPWSSSCLHLLGTISFFCPWLEPTWKDSCWHVADRLHHKCGFWECLEIWAQLRVNMSEIEIQYTRTEVYRGVSRVRTLCKYIPRIHVDEDPCLESSTNLVSSRCELWCNLAQVFVSTQI